MDYEEEIALIRGQLSALDGIFNLEFNLVS
jgi:hypothetical protein